MKNEIRKIIRETLLSEGVSNKDELIDSLNKARQLIDSCQMYVERFEWSKNSNRRLVSMSTELDKLIRSLAASNDRSFEKK